MFLALNKNTNRYYSDRGVNETMVGWWRISLKGRNKRVYMLVVKSPRARMVFREKRKEKMESRLQILNKARESTRMNWKASLHLQNHFLVLALSILYRGIQSVLSISVLWNVKSVFLPQFVIRWPLLLNCIDLFRKEKWIQLQVDIRLRTMSQVNKGQHGRTMW